jgi:hypothetical protein
VTHGDRITIGPHDLTVVDPEQDGTGSRLEPLSDATSFVAPSGATYRLADTLHGIPVTAVSREAVATPTAAAGAAPSPALIPKPLASLLVRTGEQKGRRLPINAAGVTIGRADYNDIILTDPSVSSDHATLRRRDGLWSLIDAGSMNGTFVDGEPATDETPLVPGASLRFGDVTVLFEPYDEPARPTSSPAPSSSASAAAAPFDVPSAGSIPIDARSVAEPAAPVREPTPREPVASDGGRGVPGWLIAVVLAAAAVGAAVGFALLR